MLKKAFLVASALSFLVLTACGEAYVSPFDRQVVDSNTQSSASERDPASVPATQPEDSATPTLSLYDKVLRDSNINEKALYNAFVYFDENHDEIDNKEWITVFDIGMHSGEKRFYMINMETGVVKKYHSAHGKNSDVDHDGYATQFSNTNGSYQSSLGFMLTAETYSGKWGYSMRLDGLENRNSRVRQRAIVVHGATYVNPNYSKMGRSLGCPALPMQDKDWIIREINGGSLFYIFHKNQD